MSDNILQAIDNLIGAIATLTAAQNNQNIILTATASSSCNCVIGSAPDGEGGELGGDVPPPVGDIEYGELDPEVTNRKCKAADYVVTWLVDELFLGWLIAHNLKELAGISLALAVTATGAWLGSGVPGPGTLVGAIAGLIVGAMAALFSISLDVEGAYDVMDANRQDLICALYEATSVAGARAAFQQVLIDTGLLSDLELNFIDLWMPNAFLNILFFDVTVPIDSAVYFDGYELHTGCDPCNQFFPLEWRFLNAEELPTLFPGQTGPVGTGTVNNAGDEFQLTARLMQTSGTPGWYLGIVVEGFAAAQGYNVGGNLTGNPTGACGGTLELVATSGPTNLSVLGWAGVCPTCEAFGDGFLTTGTKNNLLMHMWAHNEGLGQFTMTYQVITPPSSCS